MAFFKTLINRFKLSSTVAVNDDDADDHYQQLERLRTNHDWIEVTLTKNDKSYQSLVLDIDTENRELLIDDLYPPEKADAIEAGDTILINSKASQSLVSFYTRILARQIYDGKPCYRLELPEEVGHNHSRSAFRIYVESEAELAIDIDYQGEPLIDVRIINLSIEGLKLSFANDMTDQFQNDLSLNNCVIRLPDGEDIDCDIELRNLYRMRRPHPHTLSGGQLSINSPQHRVKLQQYLASVQRKQRRREARI